MTDFRHPRRPISPWALPDDTDHEGWDMPSDDAPYLPPSYARIGWVLLAAGPLLFLTCYPFGFGPRFVGGILGALCIVSALIALGVERWMMPGLRQDLLALQTGDHLVRWEYSPAEWLRFVRAEWSRGRWWALLIAAGLVGAVLMLMWWPGVEKDEERDFFGLVGGLVGVLVLGCVMFGSHLRRYRRGQKSVGVAYVGRGMACMGGRYCIWGRSGWRLVTARVVEGESAVLELELVAGGHTGTTTFAIPVPAGHLAEARDLVHTLVRG